jgi:hypothetical protein
LISLLNREYTLALEVMAKGGEGVLSGAEPKFVVRDLIKSDLVDLLTKSAQKFSYHQLICTFGDSFHFGDGLALNLETVLTTEEEQGTQSLFDGILHLKRAVSDSLGA